MKKFSTLILMGLLLLVAHNLFSVPAVPWPVEKQLPDGTIVSVYIKGDEKVHWMESLDGYTLLYNDSQDIVYAKRDADGDLVPSSVPYGKANPTAEEIGFISSLDKQLRYSPVQTDMLKQIWAIADNDGAKSSPAKSSVIGDKKALCILTSFSNKSMGKTKAQFENLMNQVGYSQGTAMGSVKDFYRENSYNKMDLTVTVVGPYELPNTYSYYGANDYRYLEFARAAVQAADADVDYTQFANANNELETVHIIFAGYGDEAINNGQQIWSHKWNITPSIYLDGVRISTYSCSPELRNGYGTALTGIGVICHELCHVFGADDYYDTDYQSSGGSYPTTGDWDLMSGGSWNGNGDYPAHINMFQKILYEWVDPIELTEPLGVIDMPNSAQNPVAYIIKPYTNNEQYILENRQQVGFDRGVPGKGLLIYHIHNSAANGSINNRSHPQQAYVVAAGSSVAIPNSSPSSYGSVDSSRAPFASVASQNAFTTETKPAMFRWSGSTGTIDGVLDKPLTNITQSNGLVSFDFMGGFQGPCYPIGDLKGELIEESIELSWEKPKESEELGEIDFNYSIYMNDELIVDGLEETYYTINLTEYGVYNCCIVAISEEHECESAPICVTIDYINPFDPVKLLEVAQEGKDVIISWVIPTPDEEMTIHHYELYRNDELIATLEPDRTEYTDVQPEIGTYTYTIIIYYNDGSGVSNPVDKRFEVTEFDECTQIAEMDITIDNDNVTISWNALDYILSYDLYRDRQLIAEAITDTGYTDILSASGTYEYSIVINGEECQSEPQAMTIDFIYPCDVNHIVDFEITHEDDTDIVRLDWAIESNDNRRDILFFEGFENGTGNWVLHNADGDFYDWELSATTERVHSGKFSIISYSTSRMGIIEPDNWLISSAITIGKDNHLAYWRGVMEDREGEHYAVYISTTDQDIDSFEKLLEETVSTAGWQEQVIDLSEYEGQDVYIAFRHFDSSDMLALFLDDISIFTHFTPYYNVYENGELIAETIEDNFFEKELTESGTYTFEVTYIDYCETEPVGDTIDFIHTNICDVKVDAGIRIYPTLTDGKLTIETPADARISIKDVTGRTLDTYTSTGNLTISLDYSSGVYLVMVESSDKITTSKIILK